jgi:hypothetical protein
MQALGSYEGGRMLFLGLGTGLGSTLIADHVIIPLELGQLLYKDGKMLGDLLGTQSLKRLGQKSWCGVVEEVVPMLMSALIADYVVLGGGNGKKLKQLPAGVRLGNNLTAFRGGFRLWHLKDVPTLLIDDHHFYANQSLSNHPRPEYLGPNSSEWFARRFFRSLVVERSVLNSFS